MKLTHIYKISTFSLLAALCFILAVSSCQDDPYLPSTDGSDTLTSPKSKVYITAIQLNEYPAVTPNGDLWDVVDSASFDTLGLPDVFFNITDPSPNPPVFWSQNSHFKDVGVNDTVFYILNTPYQIEPFGASIDVNVYDYELPDSTLMGTVNFTLGAYPDPFQPQIAYPNYVTSFQNGYSVTLGLRWEE